MSTFRPPPQQREFVRQDGGLYTVDAVWLQWFIDLVAQVNNANAAVLAQQADPNSLVTKTVSMADGASVNVATLTNAPLAGDPTKWVPFDDNGTTRYIPSW